MSIWLQHLYYYKFFQRFNALSLENNLIYSNVTHFWDLRSFVLKLQKVPIVMSVPFSLQLLRVTSIYWVRLKKQQILETPTILIASFKQVMAKLCALFVTLLRKVCNKRLAVSPPPVKIVCTKKNSEKRFNADTEDHCIYIPFLSKEFPIDE